MIMKKLIFLLIALSFFVWFIIFETRTTKGSTTTQNVKQGVSTTKSLGGLGAFIGQAGPAIMALFGG